MTEQSKIQWLEWAREIQALGQTGLAFASTQYETERNTRFTEIAAEIVSAFSNVNTPEIMATFLSQSGYATPKVDVRAAVLEYDKILLVKEVTDGCWALPGGWADVGDTPSKVAIRETFEESGFDIKPIKMIGVYDANWTGRPLEMFHAFKLIFLCDLIGGEAKVSNETTDVGFFSFDALPPLSINRTNEKHLGEIQAHLKDPGRPTFFD